MSSRGSPYKGLQPFCEDDAPYFFGRERETRLIIADLYAAPTTIIYGASGVGKSSVLQAGVVYRLRRSEDFIPVLFIEWDDPVPLRMLRRSVWNAVRDTLDHEANAIEPWALPAISSLRLKEFVIELETRSRRRLVIILDQFERVLSSHAENEPFVEELAAALRMEDSGSSFIVSLRDDAIAGLDRFEGRIPDLFGSMRRIKALDYEHARNAIKHPLGEYGRQHPRARVPTEIEEELVRMVLDEVQSSSLEFDPNGHDQLKGGIEAPYLQIIMGRLWNEEREVGSRTLQGSTFVSLRRGRSIVRQHVEGVIEHKAKDVQDVLIKVFCELVTSSGLRVAHSLQDLAEKAEVDVADARKILDELTTGESRLLRRTVQSSHEPVKYEFFHDRLAAVANEWLQERVARGGARVRRQNGQALETVVKGLLESLRIEEKRIAARAFAALITENRGWLGDEELQDLQVWDSRDIRYPIEAVRAVIRTLSPLIIAEQIHDIQPQIRYRLSHPDLNPTIEKWVADSFRTDRGAEPRAGMPPDGGRQMNGQTGRAGFRFIPVASQLIEPPVRFCALDLGRPHPEGSVSGSLQITWTAETPVCVGDGGDPVRPIRIGGEHVLPGASLRGMLRAVAEIATFSHLGHINADRHYGVRTYDYNDMPRAPQRHRPQDLKAGWLTYDGNDWMLRSCEIVRGYPYGFWLVHFREILDEIGRRGRVPPSVDEWRALDLGRKRKELAAANLAGALALIDDGPYVDQFARGFRKAGFLGERNLTAQERQQRRVPGYLVCAGPTEVPPDDPARAKIRETIFAPASTRPQDAHRLRNEFMRLFHALHSAPGRHRRAPQGNWRFWLTAMGWAGAFGVADTDREERDWLDRPDPQAYRNYPGIPVFYHGDPAAVADVAGAPMAERGFFIGLTRVLRLPWPYSVGEVAGRLYQQDAAPPRRYEVPRLRERHGWDFARALFGAVDDAHLDLEEAAKEQRRRDKGGDPEALAGRVAFGPAFALGDPQLTDERRGVFGTPRESFYPFYLRRTATADGNGTQRYDDAYAIPAGRKRYVVRRTPDPFPQGNENERTLTRLRFLPEGTQFTGRVRFHNLHPVEFGALLWALSFGEWGGRWRHQIGRGKAQGYGVLRANIEWRPPRVINGDDFAGERNAPETYLDLFRQYMTVRLGADYEQTDPIRLLRLYADPAVGEANKPLLATLDLDEYQRQKGAFSQNRPPGSGPILAPLHEPS